MDKQEVSSKIRKAIFNEVSVAVVIIMTAFQFVNYFTNPQEKIKADLQEIKTQNAIIQKDIEIINTNHLRHIESAITKIEEKNTKQDEYLQETNRNIQEILILLQSK